VLSVVVVAYDMARELPRTLQTLAPDYQRGITAEEYEVVVVDNGSPTPVPASVADAFGGSIRLVRLDPAPPSPARAANHGLALARGDVIGLVVDGARLASPGLLAAASRAAGLGPRTVVTAPAFHLGPTTHMEAVGSGYDQAVEDALLADAGWETDGYRLFGLSTPAGSSARGLFGPMGESSSLFAARALWDELGGMDERFELPGGGLANHDLYLRACSLPGVELVVVLGEGTFHQYHGGAATARRYSWDEMQADYAAVRGGPHHPPRNPRLYLGTVPRAALGFVERSARQAREHAARADDW
jgi:glycosyltransferase involved in cell wall biosynthesis